MADDVYRLMQQLQRPDVGSIQPVTDPRTQRVESIANMLQVLGLARTPRDAFRMANKHENFKSTVGEFLPGESYKLAQERGDKLGQGLAMIDMIPGAGLLTGPAKLAKKALPTPKKAIKGVQQIDFSTAVNRFKTKDPKKSDYDNFVESKAELIQGKMQDALNSSSAIQDPKNKAKYLQNTIRDLENELTNDFAKSIK